MLFVAKTLISRSGTSITTQCFMVAFFWADVTVPILISSIPEETRPGYPSWEASPSLLQTKSSSASYHRLLSARCLTRDVNDFVALQ